MRVISGTARGHKLMAPPGLVVRPTADRLKEALFSMIGSDVVDADFLDLFSGSGAIGIEALSRGAKECIFVEQAIESRYVILKNLEHTKLKEKAQIAEGNVVQILPRLQRQFDIIFLDPPYQQSFIEPVLEQILKYELLKEDGYVVAEHGNGESVVSLHGLTAYKIKNYKITKFVFYCRK